MKRGPPAILRQYEERIIGGFEKEEKHQKKQSFLDFHVLQKMNFAGLVQIDFSIYGLDIGRMPKAQRRHSAPDSRRF